MTDDLTPVLSRLPEPMPPSTLTATVMARIEREAGQRANATLTVARSRSREFQTWFWTFAGIGLVLMVFINGWLSSGVLPSLTAARIGFNRVPLMPAGTSVSLLLALGLIAYLAGLFAPLRSRGRG
jgi:hypothetical protein